MRTKFMIRQAKKNFFFRFKTLKVLQKNVWVVSLYTHFRGLYFFQFSIKRDHVMRVQVLPCPLSWVAAFYSSISNKFLAFAILYGMIRQKLCKCNRVLATFCMCRAVALLFPLRWLKPRIIFCSPSWTDIQKILAKYSVPQGVIRSLRLSDALK